MPPGGSESGPSGGAWGPLGDQGGPRKIKGAPRNPKVKLRKHQDDPKMTLGSEGDKKHGIRSTSEGAWMRSREESGRKSADRTHSQAFWGVPTKSGQKCNTLCKIVVCR